MFKKKCHVGEIHQTNKCGKFEVIEDNGVFDKCNQRIVKIRYLDTGYEDTVIYKNAIHNYNGQDKLRFMYENKDKIFESNGYGKYQIIEDLGQGEDKNLMCRVRFLDTGYEYDTRRKHALLGKVKDQLKFMYDNKDKVYQSIYYGPCKIISEAPYEEKDIHHQHRKVVIQFLLSGNTETVRYEDLMVGQVKDNTYANPAEAASIIGVQPIHDIRNYLFSVWKGMMDRCYNEKSTAYKSYGAKGVYVSDGWHNFEVFLNDAQKLPGWGYKLRNPLAFDIDKDFLQYDIPHNQRYYGRNTCIWLDSKTNTLLAINSNLNFIIYSNRIYSINNKIFFVKSSKNYFSYGPYFSLYDANNAPIY